MEKKERHSQARCNETKVSKVCLSKRQTERESEESGGYGRRDGERWKSAKHKRRQQTTANRTFSQGVSYAVLPSLSIPYVPLLTVTLAVDEHGQVKAVVTNEIEQQLVECTLRPHCGVQSYSERINWHY